METTQLAQSHVVEHAAAPPAATQVFTFDDPMPVMSRADILDYSEAWLSAGEWYEPPVSFVGLAKSFRAGTHHASAIYFKRNVLASTFIPNAKLSLAAFRRLALDHLVFGNSYLERVDNMIGKPLRYEPVLAKYMRRKKDLVTYVLTDGFQVKTTFEPGTIAHLMENDINQEVYGMPEYLGALHAAWLNESSTLFRRRYYENGSHAGFILYLTDPNINQADIDSLREALRTSKGPGNFRNLFMYSPQGKKDGMQLIPVSEVAAKDEFFNIKNVTRDDLLAAHRTPPQLLGIVPSNTGGFGATDTAATVYARNEIEPLQRQFEEFNELVGEEIIAFSPYILPAIKAAAGAA